MHIVIAALCCAFFPALAAAQEQKVRAERYEIDVSFQPEKGFLRARATVTLRAGQYLEAVEFELNPKLNILEVTDAQGRKLDFARSRRLGSPKLSVRLPEPCGAEQGITLTFTYEGVLPPKPLDYITKDGILLRDESRWYPAVDLSAFTQNDIRMSLPAGWRSIIGSQITEPGTEASAEYLWHTTSAVSSRAVAAYPMPLNWSCEAVTAPQQPEEPELTYTVEVCADQREAMHPLLNTLSSAVYRYGRLLGMRAPRKLVVVPGFPGQRGAIGYSAPGFLVISQDVIKYFDYPGYAPEFLPHEIAHQWFPIEVTLARQEDGWLAESLAEYLAWRYLEEKDPETARRMVARAMRDAASTAPLQRLSLGLKLFALESEEVTHATLYERGMLVWRTLETVIDRERVDRALREYYRRYAGKSASVADFQRICEEISGRDLGWFFQYFIEGTSIPEVELRRTAAAAPNEFSGEIILKNVPAEFTVRVWMRLETAAGAIEHSVATRGPVTPFTVAVPEPVTRVSLDPDQRILRLTWAAELNRRQRALLAQIGEIERMGQLQHAAEICAQALAADRENLAANEQFIRLQLGRLLLRTKRYAQAFREMARVLALDSLEPMDQDFNRAWARVYRARIQRIRGNPTAARAEARAGLAMKSPALDTPVIFPDLRHGPTTAADQLRLLAR